MNYKEYIKILLEKKRPDLVYKVIREGEEKKEK